MTTINAENAEYFSMTKGATNISDFAPSLKKVIYEECKTFVDEVAEEAYDLKTVGDQVEMVQGESEKVPMSMLTDGQGNVVVYLAVLDKDLKSVSKYLQFGGHIDGLKEKLYPEGE